MSTTDMPDAIVDFVRHHRRFAVTSHARPDGDSLGSELGLALALEGLGKEVEVVNADPHPPQYEGLPGLEKIRVANRIEGSFDALFVLECNDLDRPGLQGLERFFVINIDHHPHTRSFGQLNWIDPEAAAVGEMIYRLALELKVPLSPSIASNLYAALLTDTGSFQFSNTTSRTFQTAAALVEKGADPSRIARQIYLSHSEARLRLLARVLDTLEIHPSRRIAWVTLTRAMLQETGAEASETEGLVNYPLSIRGVDLVAFFREENENSYRVSLRSKNEFDVASVARLFGGGGHRNAAGLSLSGDWAQVRQQVLRHLELLLQQEQPPR